MRDTQPSSAARRLAAVAVLLASALGQPAASSAQDETPPLFNSVAVSQAFRTDDPGPVRTRLVTLNSDQLGPARPRAALRLNLFADVTVTAVLDRLEPLAADGVAWIGRVAGDGSSQVVLVARGGVVFGNISTAGASYQVRHWRDGLHAVHAVDASAFPPEAEPIRVGLPQAPQFSLENLKETAGQAAPPLTALADDGSLIDVLVAYTPSARNAVGGAANMQSLINLAIAETNAAYANSQVAQRLRLVHAVEVNYIESGSFNTDLNRLRLPSDGYLDEVHPLRNNYRADVASLWINDSQFCGLAYLMTSVSSFFEAWAFSVVHHACATGYYSFGHELGHNMGSEHDRANAAGPGAYPYSYGYQAPDQSFRTIMAYNCPTINCPRLPYFSNPAVFYNGQPTGVDYQSPSSADNARSLNDTALTVANFRASATFTPTDFLYLPLIFR
jgi:hypothetical protein